jgi:hypothetical protein
VQFSNGVIKIGKSRVPKSRIREHGNAARLRGLDVVNVWVSQPHADYGASEQRLWKAFGYCMNALEYGSGSEYFRGVSFDEAVEAAQQAIA